ncbi:metallophosphoesterase [Streptomyces celluloflavus]|uniref:metallophosphoesterase n=1 Tax=Streptomyces celluloflavus TaxID=58344 RepID=UPI0034606C8B|nr:metallophosphoesterase [Streptomyces celluloflavus]
MTRELQRIVATTDVHSAFADALPLLTHLHAARQDSLVVDCGDFFEGSGYYRLGNGGIERQLLNTLYDVIAPGNHGWAHHFEPDLHRLTVCANAVDDTTGDALFRRVHFAEICGRRVAVTGVIGVQAFKAIPYAQRAGHRVTEPVQALRELMLAHHHEAGSWVLLSHTGFAEDLKIAADCPFLNVIFSGHCHSEEYGPEHIGDTLVLKGPELAVGQAFAEPVGAGWAARTEAFSAPPSRLPDGLSALQEEIETYRRQLAEPLGTISTPYRNRLLDRRALLQEIASRLHTGLGAEAVLLNETALRNTPLGETLTRGDLLTIGPFGNHLVHARLENGPDLAELTYTTGPLVTAPEPFPTRPSAVLTTDYLADSVLGGHAHQAAFPLAQAVQHVLTGGERQ